MELNGLERALLIEHLDKDLRRAGNALSSSNDNLVGGFGPDKNAMDEALEKIDFLRELKKKIMS